MSLRVAMLSVHTSPLHQPGTGDAGGMNVYMVQLSRALAELGVEVDLFTRCRGEEHPDPASLGPGVRVRHLEAGPRAPLPKEDMPALVVPFSLALLKEERRYDLVHSHYWLSGQAGRIAAAGWRIPFVHTAHTLARVKNAALAEGDSPEPELRIRGEHQVVGSADRLIANTGDEARALRELYGADERRTQIVRPGVDLGTFGPGRGRADARARLGLPADAFIPLYAGRIQPLKGPDVMVRAIAGLLELAPHLRQRTLVPVVGGDSGAGPRGEAWELARALGVSDVLRHHPPVRQEELALWYRAADVLLVPSRSESFGLVALEAQACGTPVLASAVGGLPTAVRDGLTGFLVRGNDPERYARRLLWFAGHPAEAAVMGRAAVAHARSMSWGSAAAATLEVYRDVLREEGARPGADRGEAGAAARSCLADASPLEGREGRNSTLAALLG
ncbi:D-inositol-3-phosphate glycosyltransferase [Streptomyces sp. NPDC006687]|uniref:D-inositol-3-phosphate glycosyltransferase n=1 Tax=unclassified Streptomyces TaxID=2593676 RepID=UPI0033DCAFB7